MKRGSLALLVTIITVVITLTGCQSPLKGSGELQTETYDYRDFSSLEVDGPFTLTLSRGDTWDVQLTADENILDNLETELKDNTLVFKLKGSSWIGIKRIQYVDTTAELNVTVPYIRGVSLKGTAEGAITGFDTRAGLAIELDGTSALELAAIAVGDASIKVSGTSKITGDLTAGDVTLDVGDASSLELSGTACNLVCASGGASNLELGDFAVDNAEVKLRGASDAYINLTGKLDIDLGGASDLVYLGNPVMGKTKISDDSRLTRE